MSDENKNQNPGQGEEGSGENKTKGGNKSKKAQKTTLSKEQKLALYNKVEIVIPGSKEKIVNYEDKLVTLKATDAAKHLVPGQEYEIDSSTAVILIEKGFAEVVK